MKNSSKFLIVIGFFGMHSASAGQQMESGRIPGCFADKGRFEQCAVLTIAVSGGTWQEEQILHAFYMLTILEQFEKTLAQFRENPFSGVDAGLAKSLEKAIEPSVACAGKAFEDAYRALARLKSAGTEDDFRADVAELEQRAMGAVVTRVHAVDKKKDFLVQLLKERKKFYELRRQQPDEKK